MAKREAWKYWGEFLGLGGVGIESLLLYNSHD